MKLAKLDSLRSVSAPNHNTLNNTLNNSVIARIVISVVLLFSFNSCSISDPQGIVQNSTIRFEPKEVKSLTIKKLDRQKGENWITNLKYENNHWEIISAPNDENLLDRNANDSLIMHLLDSLQSLKIEDSATKGPLSSFDLDPPLVAIKWNTQNQEFEIRIGSSLKNGKGTYISFGKELVYLGAGSFFAILDQIKSFRHLRMPNWTLISSDDIDELELSQKGKAIFYAQRDGDHWADQNHKSYHSDLNPFVDSLTHSLSLDIVEDSEKTKKLQNEINSDMIYQISLKGRKSKLNWIRLKEYNGKLYGINSSRPNLVFILSPDLLHQIEVTRKLNRS